ELLHAVHDGDDAAVLALIRVLSCLALLGDLRRGRVLFDALVRPPAELAPEPSSAREGRHEHVDDEDDDSDSPAADRESSRAPAHAAPADVRDLSWIQLRALAKSHEASISGSCWTANASSGARSRVNSSGPDTVRSAAATRSPGPSSDSTAIRTM